VRLPGGGEAYVVWNLSNLGRGGLLLLAGSALTVRAWRAGRDHTVAGSTWAVPASGMPAFKRPCAA